METQDATETEEKAEYGRQLQKLVAVHELSLFMLIKIDLKPTDQNVLSVEVFLQPLYFKILLNVILKFIFSISYSVKCKT